MSKRAGSAFNPVCIDWKKNHEALQGIEPREEEQPLGFFIEDEESLLADTESAEPEHTFNPSIARYTSAFSTADIARLRGELRTNISDFNFVSRDDIRYYREQARYRGFIDIDNDNTIRSWIVYNRQRIRDNISVGNSRFSNILTLEDFYNNRFPEIEGGDGISEEF